MSESKGLFFVALRKKQINKLVIKKVASNLPDFLVEFCCQINAGSDDYLNEI